MAPETQAGGNPEARVHTTLVRANARAWGLATGLLFGVVLLVATLVLVLRGGEDVGSHLGRLSNVFPGYEVTYRGCLLGFVYAFVVGYALGRLLAPRKPTEFDSGLGHRLPTQRHVRLNSNGWALGTGALLAAALFATTNALVLRGGENVGALLHYLDIYLPGYEVTFAGSWIGALSVFAIGWLCGKVVGLIYNFTVERAEG